MLKAMNYTGIYVGVDGCKAGWIVSVLQNYELKIGIMRDLEEIISAYPIFDSFLLDMPIGLPENKDDLRPDPIARKILRSRACTIFNVPSRPAVRLIDIDKKQIQKANIDALGISIGEQSFGILPKIRQVDEFFETHMEYKNRIYESHPEICFSMLKGALVKSKKKLKEGQEERIQVLQNYLTEDNMAVLHAAISSFKKSDCNPDDILDAVCLSVSGRFIAEESYVDIKDPISGDSIPVDSHGLGMHIVAPRSAVLRTKRAFFSTWTEMDLYYAKLLWGNAEVTQYICAKGKFSQRDIINRLKTEMDNFEQNHISYFPVFTNSGTFIGCCGLRPHDRYGYEFGVHLRPEFWECGYGLELGEAIKNYAKDSLHAKTIFAGHNPMNDRSRRLLAKLGYTYIGDEYYAPTGLKHPSYCADLKSCRRA